MSADLLRQAADKLRDPLLCNFPTKVGLPLADAMDAVARVVRYDERAVARVCYGELVAVAEAVLGDWWS